MRRSGASLRGLLREEGGRPPFLECSRPALLLMTCLECGDGCGAMRGIWDLSLDVDACPGRARARIGHTALGLWRQALRGPMSGGLGLPRAGQKNLCLLRLGVPKSVI